ncbi:hypothetical protein ACN4EE_10565 [Geminocystis sp. CENA526]|uniref:hypothetical protein n=1 Tax=Geminocystis sp. CENA526 TaxID=1355871 RepID=UPI003D6E4207
MNIQKAVLDNLKDLSIDKQKTVLEFVKFLKYQEKNQPIIDLNFKGLWEDLNFSVNEDDIATARQEIWANFGKEIEL